MRLALACRKVVTGLLLTIFRLIITASIYLALPGFKVVT